eukprot:6049_1
MKFGQRLPTNELQIRGIIPTTTTKNIIQSLSMQFGQKIKSLSKKFGQRLGSNEIEIIEDNSIYEEEKEDNSNGDSRKHHRKNSTKTNAVQQSTFTPRALIPPKTQKK